VKCSEELIEKVREKTDLSVCPNCLGAEHILHPDSGIMEPCFCRIRRLDKKYFSPLKPLWYHKDVIPKNGLPDYSQNLHRIISGNFSSSQVRFLFAYMLKEAKRPKYFYTTMFELKDIHFGEIEEGGYQNLTSFKSNLIIVNAAVGEAYFDYMDTILTKVLFIYENKNIPVWVCIPHSRFPVTRNYNKDRGLPNITSTTKTSQINEKNLLSPDQLR